MHTGVGRGVVTDSVLDCRVPASPESESSLIRYPSTHPSPYQRMDPSKPILSPFPVLSSLSASPHPVPVRLKPLHGSNPAPGPVRFMLHTRVPHSVPTASFFWRASPVSRVPLCVPGSARRIRHSPAHCRLYESLQPVERRIFITHTSAHCRLPRPAPLLPSESPSCPRPLLDPVLTAVHVPARNCSHVASPDRDSDGRSGSGTRPTRTSRSSPTSAPAPPASR